MRIKFSKWPPRAALRQEIHFFAHIFMTERIGSVKVTSKEASWQAATFGYLEVPIKFSKWPPRGVFRHKIHIFAHFC